MVCSMTRSQVKVKVTSPSQLEIRLFSKAISSATYNGAGNWPLILKLGPISKFDRAGFMIFVPVFVSRDFELGTNVNRTGIIHSCSFW